MSRETTKTLKDLLVLRKCFCKSPHYTKVGKQSKGNKDFRDEKKILSYRLFGRTVLHIVDVEYVNNI